MVISVEQLNPQKRPRRRPSFPIAGTMVPYGLYPLWAHPVLPGETLQSMSAKMRTVSLPVKHPLCGAWQEQWLCYVKLTDISKDLGQMFISDDVASGSWEFGADLPRFFGKDGQIRWLKEAVEKIHSAYFLDDDETKRGIDTVPMVKLNNVSWYQNMVFEATDEAIPTTDASDLYAHLQGWQMLQQMKMTELTYEKYLETYGARPTSEQLDRPEILRFGRSWTTPVNTVEPTTGSPSSAFVWSDEFKLDKPKRFEEPGFLVALATVRPKMYQGNLGGSMIGNLWGFSDWYPSYTLQDPTAGVKKLQKADLVFAAALDDAGGETLLYDHRDLLMHGEQFVNDFTTQPYALPVSSGMNLDTGSSVQDLQGQYPLSSDLDAMFTGGDAQLYYEGMAFCDISGHVMESTPR